MSSVSSHKIRLLFVSMSKYVFELENHALLPFLAFFPSIKNLKASPYEAFNIVAVKINVVWFLFRIIYWTDISLFPSSFRSDKRVWHEDSDNTWYHEIYIYWSSLLNADRLNTQLDYGQPTWQHNSDPQAVQNSEDAVTASFLHLCSYFQLRTNHRKPNTLP